MDELEKKSLTDSAIEWLDVTSNHTPGDANRLGPYLSISKNGAAEALVDSTALIEQVARARGLHRHQYVLHPKAGVAQGIVGCIPIPLEKGTTSSISLRWVLNEGSPRVAFHIGGVFKDYPELALSGDIKCIISKGTAPDGLPMLLIPVKAVLNTHTTHRNTEEHAGS